MANTFFQFKQFVVYHHRSSMKVGVDGVLIGAWADVSACETILDVGCGSGLIALMMAQRRRTARITAIDIDVDSVQQAQYNFQLSPWADRLNGACVSLQTFVVESKVKFDLIVSNPPFFNASLLSPNSSRTNARHTTTLTHRELCQSVASLLSEKGRFEMVIPTDMEREMVGIAEEFGLFLSRKCTIFPTPIRPSKRLLLSFSLIEEEVKNSELIIETTQRGIYTDVYRDLTREFYIKEGF